MTQHPDVRFELDFNDRQIDLMQEGFDLAIRIATLADSSLIARRLAPIRHVVCASPGLPGAARHAAAAADLAQHACLAYSNLSDPGLWSYRGPDGQPGSVHVPVRLAASSGEFLMQVSHRRRRAWSSSPPSTSMKPCARGSWCSCWPTTRGRSCPPTRCIRPRVTCRAGRGP